MSGISPISGRASSVGWLQAQYYLNMSAARRAAANPARAETPVEPVQPVRPLPSDTPVRFPISFAETALPTVDDLNNASENLAKMRISYAGGADQASQAEQTGMFSPLRGQTNGVGEVAPRLDQQFPSASDLQQLKLGELEAQLALKEAALEYADNAARSGAPGETPEALRGALPGRGGEKAAAGEEAEKGLEGIGVGQSESAAEVMDEAKCETCEKRKYQDGSDDPGVSFKNPTNIKPEQAESAVRGHEQEHVVRERAKAEREGREVVSQSVSIHTGICPECGKVYVSGGTTRTVTRPDQSDETDALRSEKKRSGAEAMFGAVA